MVTIFKQIAMNAVSSEEKSVVLSGMRTVYWLAKKYNLLQVKNITLC